MSASRTKPDQTGALTVDGRLSRLRFIASAGGLIAVSVLGTAGSAAAQMQTAPVLAADPPALPGRSST